MHSGHYVFAQITKFLPKRYFERLTVKYYDRTRGWSLSHWSHLLVLMFGQLLGCRSLRELTDITTLQGSTKSIAREHSSSFEKSFIPLMRLRAVLALRREKITSSVTRLFASQERGTKRIIQRLFDVLCTTLQSLSALSLTTRTTSVLGLRILHSFTNTGARSSCSSSGTSSISASRPFGENLRMLSVFRYMLPSSHIASLVSLNMTCRSGRPIVEVMRILGSSLLTLDDVRDLLESFKRMEEKQDGWQLCYDFQFC